MSPRVLAALALVAMIFAAPISAAESKAITQLTFAPESGKPNIDVWITRASDDDGGLAIKLIARGVGAKAQALTLYTGGGGDEGPGDSDVKSIGAKVFELPEGRKAVRVDFTYQMPEGKKREIQTDTWLVGFQGKTHKLMPEPLRTRFSSDRGKNCREREETTLTAESDAEGVVVVAARAERVDAVYGDDDLPVDKSCRAAPGIDKKAFRLAVEEGKPPASTATNAIPPAGAPDGGAPAPAPSAAKTPPAPSVPPAANPPAPPAPSKTKPAATDSDD